MSHQCKTTCKTKCIKPYTQPGVPKVHTGHFMPCKHGKIHWVKLSQFSWYLKVTQKFSHEIFS